MHTIKVGLLLLVTLAVMRVASWLVGWIVFRLAGRSPVFGSVCGNVIALGLFALFLQWNLAPGESFDLEPLVFGIVVYTVFQLLDLKWCPWSGRRGVVPPAA